MGLILDSSVAIAAERRGDTVQAFVQHAIDAASDQEAALSAVGVVELVHGIHRADTAERRARREAFVEELLSAVVVYPLTTDVARLAGKLDAEQQSRGIVIPFADLLIGATALWLGYSVLTVNPRHFDRVPVLRVIRLQDPACVGEPPLSAQTSSRVVRASLVDAVDSF